MAETLDGYQSRAADTAIYPGQGELTGLLYCALGLGEAGEVQGKVKKLLRDHAGELTVVQRDAMGKELGDLLWYVAMTAHELGLSLGDIAVANLAKLASRRERGVLGGNGDDR
ncbi:nucleoside triphosphate pyrophosphohydrolase family protein [Nocardia thailandica]|uniref:nucleoside triphosphate pyrophosphohydrolase family protein n=1 Tax=Nocardia thailandica TaxID=257275 RepID=UPI0005BC0CFB|nr:nucleoside triphosphate pyrophosphohydrolase family protein [Nocardia thailandica]